MLNRPPLVAYETFVADPVALPVRKPGETGLSAVTRGEVVRLDGSGVRLRGVCADGSSLAVEVSVAGAGVVRVRLSEDTQAESRSARALPLMGAGRYEQARVERHGDVVYVDAGSLVAELTLDPWQLRFLAADGRVLVAQNPGEYDISGRMRTLPFGRSTVDGMTVAYHETFTAAADEHFVGLGERFTGFDKRGQRALMWNFDAFGAESDRAYKNVPLYLSSRGYGVVVDSGMATEFDMCQSTNSCDQIVVPDDLIEYYVIAGPSPAEVLDRYNELTSRPCLPPKWAFGTWISSGFFVDTQEAVLERARRIRERGIPCDVLHLDCYWQVAGNWSDLRWDRANFPDPQAMLAELARQGFRVCLWINSYISERSPVFAEAAARGFLLRCEDGSVYVADVWHGSFPACGIVDFTDSEATAWFQDLLRPLLQQGVAVFKTDFGEGVPADAVAANGMTGAELHNVYSLLFNDAVAAVTQEVNGHAMVWARSSFLGGQRLLRLSGINCCRCVPADGAVVGWIVAGCRHGPLRLRALSPLVRLHGTTSRLPWDFPDAEQAATEALRLRYELMPYLYSAALDRVPLFARHGAMIPTTDPRDVVDDQPFPGITLLSFGAGPGQAVIHDVDGGTTVHTRRSADTLTIDAAGPARIDAIRFAPVPGASAPATVVIDGAATVLTIVDGWVVATRPAKATSPTSEGWSSG